MPHSPESDGDEGRAAQAGGELSERLLARRVRVGVIDVGSVQQQYARTADWMAQRFAVMGDLHARYGTTESRAAGSAAPLPIVSGHYTREESETPPSPDGDAPTGGVGRAAEISAPPAVERGGGGGGPVARSGGAAPTIQRKAAPPEKPAPPVSKQSPPPVSAAPSAVMTLAVETARPPSLGVSTAEAAPEATSFDIPPAAGTREAGGDNVPSVPAAPPLARELAQAIGETGDTAAQLTLAPERGRAAETANSGTATDPEPRHTLLAHESPRATGAPVPTIMRTARGAEGSPPIQRAPALNVEASKETAAEPTPYAPAPPVASVAPAAPAVVVSEHLTGVRATVQRAAAAPLASESRAQTRVSAPEIHQAPALPLAAKMVWRKAVGTAPAGGQGAAGASMPYVTPAFPPPPGVNPQTVYRAQASAPALARAQSQGDGYAAAPTPAAPAQPGAAGPSLEQITEHVSRVILRRIAVERERRGARRWL